VSGRNRGFTLLEVLLAMTVLGVVVAMLSLSLSASLKATESTEREEAIYFQAQTAMHRITADLAAAFPVRENALIGEKQELNGLRADRLTVVSVAHLTLNPQKQQPGPATIRYRLRTDAEDGRKLLLLRSDTPLLPGMDAAAEDTAEPAFLLADNLRSMQLTFFDRQGQEFDNWRQDLATIAESAEPTETALPAAVHCILEFWIDPDRQTTQTFSTRVLLPAESADAN